MRYTTLFLLLGLLPTLIGCGQGTAAVTPVAARPVPKESLQPQYRPAEPVPRIVSPKLTAPAVSSSSAKLEPQKSDASPSDIRDTGRQVAQADAKKPAASADSASDAPKSGARSGEEPQRSSDDVRTEPSRRPQRNEGRPGGGGDSRGGRPQGGPGRPDGRDGGRDARPDSRGTTASRDARPDGTGTSGVGGFGDPAGFGGGFGEFAARPASTGPKFKAPTIPSNIPSFFTSHDKDGDGQVSMDEWPRGELSEFARYDRNGDGIITIEEAMRFATPSPSSSTSTAVASTTTSGSTSTPVSSTPGAAAPPSGTVAPPAVAAGSEEERLQRSVKERLLDRYDRNKDGKLDEAEVQATQMLKFNWQQYDSNKDKFLDMPEMVAYMKSIGGGGFGNFQGGGFGGGGFQGGGGAFGGGPPGGFGRPGGPGGGGGFQGGGGGFGGGGRQGFGGSPEDRVKDMITRSDKNGDGKLSVDELPFFIPKERFPEFDANKDGLIDTQELMQGFERMRRR